MLSSLIQDHLIANTRFAVVIGGRRRDHIVVVDAWEFGGGQIARLHQMMLMIVRVVRIIVVVVIISQHNVVVELRSLSLAIGRRWKGASQIVHGGGRCGHVVVEGWWSSCNVSQLLMMSGCAVRTGLMMMVHHKVLAGVPSAVRDAFVELRIVTRCWRNHSAVHAVVQSI